jgi:hypothetical protein
MRPIKSVIVAHFSTFPQRRIVARIDRMGEKILLRPAPELTDIRIGFDGLVLQFQAVFCALGDYFFFGGMTGNSR